MDLGCLSDDFRKEQKDYYLHTAQVGASTALSARGDCVCVCLRGGGEGAGRRDTGQGDDDAIGEGLALGLLTVCAQQTAGGVGSGTACVQEKVA